MKRDIENLKEDIRTKESEIEDAYNFAKTRQTSGDR
jgi:hypothetical protein